MLHFAFFCPRLFCCTPEHHITFRIVFVRPNPKLNATIKPPNPPQPPKTPKTHKHQNLHLWTFSRPFYWTLPACGRQCSAERPAGESVPNQPFSGEGMDSDPKVSETCQASAGDAFTQNTDYNDCLTFWKVKWRRRTKMTHFLIWGSNARKSWWTKMGQNAIWGSGEKLKIPRPEPLLPPPKPSNVGQLLHMGQSQRTTSPALEFVRCPSASFLKHCMEHSNDNSKRGTHSPTLLQTSLRHQTPAWWPGEQSGCQLPTPRLHLINIRATLTHISLIGGRIRFELEDEPSFWSVWHWTTDASIPAPHPVQNFFLAKRIRHRQIGMGGLNPVISMNCSTHFVLGLTVTPCQRLKPTASPCWRWDIHIDNTPDSFLVGDHRTIHWLPLTTTVHLNHCPEGSPNRSLFSGDRLVPAGTTSASAIAANLLEAGSILDSSRRVGRGSAPHSTTSSLPFHQNKTLNAELNRHPPGLHNRETEHCQVRPSMLQSHVDSQLQELTRTSRQMSWGSRVYCSFRQPENSKRAHFKAPALQTPPKFHEKTPREGRKNENCGGRGNKKARNFGPHPSGPHCSGPHPSGHHCSGPPPFGAPPSPTFLSLGPPPFKAPTRTAPTPPDPDRPHHRPPGRPKPSRPWKQNLAKLGGGQTWCWQNDLAKLRLAPTLHWATRQPNNPH